MESYPQWLSEAWYYPCSKMLFCRMQNPIYYNASHPAPKSWQVQVNEENMTVRVAGGVTLRVLMDSLANYTWASFSDQPGCTELKSLMLNPPSYIHGVPFESAIVMLPCLQNSWYIFLNIADSAGRESLVMISSTVSLHHFLLYLVPVMKLCWLKVGPSYKKFLSEAQETWWNFVFVGPMMLPWGTASKHSHFTLIKA